ncbi:protein FAM78B isoform X1 [Heterocephalus glaber]|uniref:Protein FAM78B isoform X1 n=3 Tax=Boreoeutheria TaxID=1437010 RepID=A0AAX6RSX6_HETGA|nr:protein FAM78B isoform X1 [Heterocephalus glaber]
MGCIQSITCKARIRRENIVVYDVCATIDQCPTRIEETSPIVLRYKTPYFKASARVVMPPIPRHETWVVGWIQACNQMEFFNTYSDLGILLKKSTETCFHPPPHPTWPLSHPTFIWVAATWLHIRESLASYLHSKSRTAQLIRKQQNRRPSESSSALCLEDCTMLLLTTGGAALGIELSAEGCPQPPLPAASQLRSSWELPDLREGRVKAISDSDGVSYPWYGNTTETVTLIGPTNKISRFSVSMNDNFYPSVTWAVPVSDSNVPLLTRIKRDQSFTTWLVAMNTTTKEKIILQTIKWRMRVDIEVDPLQLLGQRARLVGRTQQEQPRILSRMEPIPPNALVKPNANDAQVLMWRPKRGPPLVVIPPK